MSVEYSVRPVSDADSETQQPSNAVRYAVLVTS